MKKLLAMIMLALALTVPAQGFCSSANSASSYNKKSGIETFVGVTGDVLIGAGGITGMIGLVVISTSSYTVVGFPVGAVIGLFIAFCGGVAMLTGYAMEGSLFIYNWF